MFFETMYRIFERLFGANLADYLAGYNCQSETFTGSNQFVPIGFLAVAIAGVSVLLYYYVINHPRFNRLGHWLIVLAVVGIVNLFIGNNIVSSDLAAGNIGDCLLYIDENKEFTSINPINCWGFGIANCFVSAIWFIVFSFAFKWWSRNCKYSPF